MNDRNKPRPQECEPDPDSHGIFSRRDLLRRAGMTAGAAVALGMGIEYGTGLAPATALADEGRGPRTKPTVVLVHGAWADGSSWNEVSALLQAAGYPVTAAGIPLTSLADDVARVQAVLDLQQGPVVLVGHSIGGAVISGAGVQPNVKALVYISAFAPDEGESLGRLGGTFPPEPGTSPTSLFPDSQGFLYLTRSAYLQYFAPDVPQEFSRILAADQRPVNAAYLSDLAGPAAWKTLPSWFLISTKDQMINPDLQRFESQRMGATSREVASSHVSLISHPLQVVQLINQAAKVAVAV